MLCEELCAATREDVSQRWAPTLHHSHCSPAITTVSNSFVVVLQSLSQVWLFAIPWIAARQASLSSTISWSLLKFMSIESVMPSNHFILWPLLLFCLLSFPASGSFPMRQLFTSDSYLIVINWIPGAHVSSLYARSHLILKSRLWSGYCYSYLAVMWDKQ